MSSAISSATNRNAVYRNIESHLPALRRFARTLAGSGGADDLVQDCVERALSRSHLFQQGTNLRAWLFTIMRNLFVSGTRRARRAGPVVDPDFAHGALSVAPCQEHAVLLNEVGRALPDLPEGQRRAIELIAISGLAYEDAADEMRTGIGTVRSRLSRGREALRRYSETESRKAA